MGIAKIEVYKAFEDGKLGLGVRAAGEPASLGDLLRAWEPLADDSLVGKKYAAQDGVCRACTNNCCNAAFVIPDLISFKAMCQSTSGSPQEFIDRYFEQSRVKNGLARLKSGPCPFLTDRVCTIYRDRSLICRFYLCCNILGETEELIYSIVTCGITATTIWLQERGLLTASNSGMTGYDRAMLDLIEQYKNNPGTLAFFTAESYDDIPLGLFLK